MKRTYNTPYLKERARELRKSMTKEEKHLWFDFLKKLPVTIKRQKIIGNYIADFYCAEAKLVIELDGSQHYEKDGREKDIERDSYLNSLGIKVLRYPNVEIAYNFDGVCQDIYNNIFAKN